MLPRFYRWLRWGITVTLINDNYWLLQATFLKVFPDPFLLQRYSLSTSSTLFQTAARLESKRDFKARTMTGLQKTARIRKGTSKQCFIKHPSSCPRDTEDPRSKDDLTFLLPASSVLEQPTQLTSPQLCCSKQKVVQGGCSVLSQRHFFEAEIQPITSLPLVFPHFIKSPAAL